MSVFSDLRKAIEHSGRHVIAAKVTATDSALMTADVTFEGEQVIREAVPLRIFNDEGGLGVAFIPKIGSEVLIGFIDGAEARPQILKVQEWDSLIVRKGPANNPALEITVSSDNQIDLRKDSGFQFTIDTEDKVSIGNAPSHSLGWGDAWLQEFNNHIHPTPTGPSGKPVIQLSPEQVNSQIFEVE